MKSIRLKGESKKIAWFCFLFLLMFSIGGMKSASAQYVISDSLQDWVDNVPEEEFEELDSAEIDEDIYVPADLQFIPADVLYDGQWNNKYVSLHKSEFKNQADRYTLLLEKDGDTPCVFPYKGKVISPFGFRGRRVHAGTDIKLDLNDPVVCAFDGVVRMATRYGGYGLVVVVRHNNGLETLYGHLNKIKVRVNQIVKAGDLVGLGGRTGRATTTHLHFETRFLGEAFNPEKVFDLDNHILHSDTLIITKNTFRIRSKKNKHIKEQSEERNNEDEIVEQITKRKTNYHTVRKGDTLSEIARKYNTTVTELCHLNKIKKTANLKLGKRLKIRG